MNNCENNSGAQRLVKLRPDMFNVFRLSDFIRNFYWLLFMNFPGYYSRIGACHIKDFVSAKQ